VAMAVMAILMTAAMPVWKQTAQREKEAELVFRGQQYVHAIQLFQRRSGPGTYPPSIDFLVQQKYLRKKYKDPITNSDFVPLSGALPVAPPGATPVGASGSTTTSSRTGISSAAGTGATVTTVGPDGAVPGGVAGVVSKSTDTSIRIYNGQTKYNQWVFRALPPPTPPGPAGAGGAGQRGGPGGPNQPPGGLGGAGTGRGGPQRGGPLRGGFGAPNGPPNAPPIGPPPNGGRGFQVLPDGRVIQVPSGR
jgi:type II secretory pathway pseudopilin PulG